MIVSKGFTLIELTAVIIILGVLAAFAVPKYMELSTSARISAVNKLKGTIGSAAIMTRLAAKTLGVKSGVVTIDASINAKVAVHASSYYPIANNTSGITKALESYDGFTTSGNTTSGIKFTLIGAKNSANCYVKYILNAKGVPVITTVTSGC